MSTERMRNNNARRLAYAIIMLTIVAMATKTDACSGKMMLRIGGLGDYDKQIIVDMHNRMRQSVALGEVRGQPPAANMMEMKWDNALALKAEKWAASCYQYTHDGNRHTSEFLVGQNIATKWTSRTPSDIYDMKPDFDKDAIRKWFNEFKNFHYGGFGHGMTGHYTQMIWANTRSIGCGFAFYYDPSKGFTKNYVCNYGPSGNVIGEAPYQKGYPQCYAFSLSESKKYNGLCDARNDYFLGFSNYIG